MEQQRDVAGECIAACLACHQECLRAFSGHCLEVGGDHVAPAHVRLMLSCAEVCRAAAQVMMLGDPRHGALCTACAAFCEACADDCEALGDMDDCVDACRACAEACRAAAEDADGAGMGRRHAALSERAAAEMPEGGVVRPAGPDAMRDPPRDWKSVDEVSDQSFPASDPPSTY